MATCILHIGLPKTGSSALQRYCNSQREVLGDSHGITYYDFLENHGILTALYKDDPSSFQPIRNLGYTSKPAAQAYLAQACAHLEHQAATCGTPYFLISGEAFSGARPRDIPVFRDYLLQHFDAVRIVCYLRAPHSWMNSAVQEVIKGGFTFDHMPSGTGKRGRKPTLPKYRDRLTRYMEAYGAENVEILDFSKDVLVEGNLVYDFFSRVFGIEKDGLAKPPARINESLSAEAVHFLEAYNRRVPLYVDGVHNPDRAPNMSYLVDTLSQVPGHTFNIGNAPIDFSDVAPTLGPDTEWLAETTEGRIDFRAQAGAPVPSQDAPDGNDHLEFLAAFTNTVLRDKHNADLQVGFFRALLQLNRGKADAEARVKQALAANSDPSFLQNAAYMLREDGHYVLAGIAINRCLSEAKRQGLIDISKTARKAASAIANFLGKG